ncbi:hypothetical protein OCAE111667_24900 [Occultella aeris]|uniref:Uncharacterized protein n=1 Tax=Occultella aeris TaxID=2761496 RepID=A0A7M4DF60_9MICO|nr:hypothetical protein [Occultella aeris]VZO35553.1 hypothetical protein HALOF300_00751 [Occultella aeris]
MVNSTGAAVVVRGLRVIRGAVTALDGVDLDVAEGLITGLLALGSATLRRRTP